MTTQETLSMATATLSLLAEQLGGNMVLLSTIRSKVPGMPMDIFQAAVTELRRGAWTADTSDGRHRRLSDEERSVRTADGMVYLSKRWVDSGR